MLNMLLASLEINVSSAVRRTISAAQWDYKDLALPWNRLYLVTGGEGFLSCHHQELRLVPGNLYFIPAHTALTSHCPRSITKYWTHFSAKIFSGLELFNLLPSARVFKPERPREYRFLFERLIAAGRGGSLGNKLEQEGAIRLLTAPFLARLTEDTLNQRLREVARFKEVLTYMEANLATPATLAELAAINHLSPQHFATIFKKHLGLSPIQYYNRRRIEKAVSLLLGTDDGLAEIAQKLGFEDVFYFSRLFKKTTGLAPSFYRRRNYLGQADP